MTEQYSIIYTSLILHGARLETQAMKNWRQKGRYGGRKGCGEVGGERREGFGSGGGELELPRVALPALARLGTYLASGWEAGGPGSRGRYPLASHRVALSSLGGTSIGRMVGQGGEKGPSHFLGR